MMHRSFSGPGVSRSAQPGTSGEGDAGAFASLRVPQFRWLFASNLAFFFAMNAQMLVRSYLAYDLTHSPLALGFVNFAVAIPMLVISPFGGALADRLERRRLVVAGQLALVASESTIWLLLLLGRLQFWHMLVSVSIAGCCFPFIMPARQALVVNAVGMRAVGNAMALSMSSMNAARVLGPVVGGLLISAVGIRHTYALSISLYLCAIACMFAVHPAPPRADARERPILEGIREGFRFVRDDRTIGALLLFGIVPMFLAMPFQTLLVVFANDVWKVGSLGFGALQAAAGVGGVIGSLFVAWYGEPERRVRSQLANLAAFAIALFLFGLSPWFALALPLVLVANVCASVFSTQNNTGIQLLIPDHVRGRIMSFMMMSFGLTPLGTLPVSALAQGFGAPVAVCTGAVWLLLVGAAFYLWSPALRRTDERTSAALAEYTTEPAIIPPGPPPEAAA